MHGPDDLKQLKIYNNIRINPKFKNQYVIRLCYIILNKPIHKYKNNFFIHNFFSYKNIFFIYFKWDTKYL